MNSKLKILKEELDTDRTGRYGIKNLYHCPFRSDFTRTYKENTRDIKRGNKIFFGSIFGFNKEERKQIFENI